MKDVIGQVIADGNRTTPGTSAEAWGKDSKIKAGVWGAKASLGGSATADGAMALGYDSAAIGGNSVALGRQTRAKGGNSVAIGKGATVDENQGNTIAIGLDAKGKAANAVALGFNSEVTENDTVSVGNAGYKRRIVNVSEGKNPNDVVIYKQVFGTVESNGNNKNPSGEAEVWGPYAKIKAGAWSAKAALGGSAMADGAMALGYASEAIGGNSVSLGRQTKAKGNDSVAIGKEATVDVNQGNTIAIGTGAKGKATNAVALGANSEVTENDTVSVGNAGYKRRIVNVEAGKNPNDVVIYKQVFGTVEPDGNNKNPYGQSEAWGPNSKIKAGKWNVKAALGGSALDNDAMAIGHQSVAQGSSSLAVGNTAKANVWSSIAIGKDAEIINKNTGNDSVSGGAAVAIGNSAKAWGKSSVALGQSSKASEEKTVSVGKVGMYRRIVNVEDGKNPNDVVIYKQVFGTVEPDGDNKNPYGQAEAWGPNSKIKAGKWNAKAALGGSAMANGAMALGYDSVAIGGNSLALGYQTKAKGDNSVAIGDRATVDEKKGNTIAIGREAKDKAANAVALGSNSEVTEDNTVSVGNQNTKRRIVNVEAGRNPNDVLIYSQVLGTATGSSAIALGPSSTAPGYLSTAIGNNSKALGNFAVALGYDSVAHNDEVSIGNAEKNFTRKLVNVRNGNIAKNSTDAVNGHQLWELREKTNAFENNYVRAGESKSYGLAVGAASHALGYLSVAMGNDTHATGNHALALGYNSKATGHESIAAGRQALAQQGTAIAIGNYSIAGLSEEGYKDPIWTAKDENDNPIYSSTDPEGKIHPTSGAVAIGNDAKALGYRNIAIGENAYTAKSAYDDKYKPLVKNAGTNKPVYDKAGVIGSIAIGGYAITEGSHSTVIGNAAYALGNHTSAYGIRSYAVGSRSSAFGNSATVMEADGVALGSMARVNEGDKNSVALGNNSITEKVQSTKSYTIPTSNADYIKQIKDGKTITFAGSEASGTVSIGGVGVDKYLGDKNDKGVLIGYTDPYEGAVMRQKAMYRTITNVAAGRISETSTDAINGSQLYYVLGQTQINAENIAKAGQDLTGIKDQVDKNTEGLKEQGEKIKQIEAKDKDQDKAIKDLQDKQGTIDGKIDGITEGLDKFKEETGKKFDDVNKRVEDVKKTADQNKKEIETIRNSQSDQVKTIEKITNTVNDHETRITNNEKVIKEHTETIKENQEKIANNSERISENRRDIDLNRQDIDALAQAQQQSLEGVRRAISDVSRESRQGDAMNAALAALKPLPFDPDEKTQFMAGVGGYKGEYAYALGLAHYFNDSVMANVGGAYTNGTSMIWNAGVTIKFGSSYDKKEDGHRTRMLYTPDYTVKEHIQSLEQALAQSKKDLADLQVKSQAEIDQLHKEVEALRQLIMK